MRESSRHGPSRPDRKGGGRGTGPRGESRPGRRQAQAPPATRGPQGQPGERPLPVPAVSPERVTGLIEPVVGRAGMDLESVRVAVVGRRLLLRVVVDADGGVALDDIAGISREIGAVLDGDEVMRGASYTLEVSSPGVERPLTEPRHWRRAVGRLVHARVTGGTAASLQGRVVGVTDDGVTLDVGGVRRTFGYGELGPGKVQVEFGRVAAEPAGPDGGEPDGH